MWACKTPHDKLFVGLVLWVKPRRINPLGIPCDNHVEKQTRKQESCHLHTTRAQGCRPARESRSHPLFLPFTREGRSVMEPVGGVDSVRFMRMNLDSCWCREKLCKLRRKSDSYHYHSFLITNRFGWDSFPDLAPLPKITDSPNTAPDG